MSSLNIVDQDFETGIKLIREAYTKKISRKEAEIGQLRDELVQRDNEIQDLQQENQELNQQIHTLEQKVQELSRSVAKLNKFRKNVLDSIGVGAGEDTTDTFQPLSTSMSAEQTVFKSMPKIEQRAPSNSSLKNISIRDDSFPKPSSQPQPSKQRVTSRATIASPPVNSPRLKAMKPASHNVPSSTLRPKTAEVEITTSSTLSAKPTEVAISSEPIDTSGTTTVDGRDFFRKAKSVLSYDQFTQLLWNVKAYNTRDQSRQRTLDNVFQAIGETHPDMYDAFEALLTVR